jgi:glutamyl-tRNA reductase
MADLFVVGLSWRTAPVAIREQLAFREDELAGVVERLRAQPAVAEAMLISTCNRVEVYGVTRDDPAQAAAEACRFLLAERGLATTGRGAGAEVATALYQKGGDDAALHVFRVASALDSLVVGEAQILGQLKDAYALAGQVGAVGSVLARCVERAFGTAKRVRTETPIARGAANVSTVAVDLAQRVFGDLRGTSVLVIGAGKMSRLAARHLHAAGVVRIVVTNRSFDKAQALADEIDGQAQPFDQLERLLTEADVVISSTGARVPILTAAMMKKVVKARRWKPMMIVDIAVPRDAEAAVGELEGVYLFHIDDLERVVAANLSERQRAAVEAERIVSTEVRHFVQWMRSQRVVPTIRALRAHFAQVAEVEVARTIEQLQRREHSPAQRDEAIRRLGQLVVAKLLHQPQTVLKESPEGAIDARVEAAAALFGLTVDTEPADGPGPEAGTELDDPAPPPTSPDAADPAATRPDRSARS